MSHKTQRYLVIVAMVATAIVAGACGGGAAPTGVPATAVPATIAVPASPTSVPNTSAPATSAPTVAVSTATVPAAATDTQVAPPTTAATASAVAPTTQSASDNWIDPTPGKFTAEDVNHIFPPGHGQDLVFQNCTNCHNWVPIVFAQLDKNGWEQNRINHENRVTAMSQEDKDFLYNYLITNFPPDKAPPDNIPQELLDQWTSY